jgi:hypothetical protein
MSENTEMVLESSRIFGNLTRFTLPTPPSVMKQCTSMEILIISDSGFRTLD